MGVSQFAQVSVCI